MIESIYQWVAQQVQHNEIFAGIMGGSVFASILYATRRLPEKFWSLFKFNYTVESVILSDTEAFGWVRAWLGASDQVQHKRRVRIVTINNNNNEKRFIVTLGAGTHLLWHRGRPLLVTLDVDSEKSQGMTVIERYTLTSLGRSQNIIRSLVTEARDLVFLEGHLPIHAWRGWWRQAAQRPTRALHTVIMPHRDQEAIAADLAHFYDSAAWYFDRGISWRRGYLLSGPPGCGKTSLVVALASWLQRPLYVLNLGSVDGDADLQSAFETCGEQGILLIEDIDAAQHAREAGKNTTDEDDKAPVSLSGLLNVLDGALSPQGQIVFMTTNFPQKLDAALIRPGRIDWHLHIGLADQDMARTLFAQFYPEADPTMLQLRGLMPAAQMQQVFMEFPGQPVNASQKLALVPSSGEKE